MGSRSVSILSSVSSSLSWLFSGTVVGLGLCLISAMLSTRDHASGSKPAAHPGLTSATTPPWESHKQRQPGVDLTAAGKMGPRREILDSEDDGSDFGDEGEFGDAAAPELDQKVLPLEMDHGTVDASRSTDATVSTYPSFFQRVYDQQQAAAAADTQDAIPDTAPPAGLDPAPGPAAASTWTEVSSAPPPGQKHQPGSFSSLTSITNPVPASRKSKRAQEPPQSEVIDLTDVPTPRKPDAGPPADPWDVPPSSSSSQRVSRTYGKRKIAPLSLEQESVSNTMPPTQDPYAFPESTPPVRKKATRRETPVRPTRKAQDSSPVLLVPTEAPASSDRPTRSSRKKKGSSFSTESTMPDTAAPSLYVAQSTLTASQKQEYQVVSLSSDAGPEIPEMLPPEQPFRAGETYRSSGATTIAYPTPSRAAVSSRRLPEIEEDGGEVSFVETSLPQETHYQVRCSGY